MSNEVEIEKYFLTKFAQTELDAEELGDIGGAIEEAAKPEGEEGLPNIDTDMTEMEAIKNLIPWDSFSIIFDPHYSKILEDTLGLPPAKSKAKSYYIYFSNENKRLEGVVNKRYIGGYGTKEDLGDDFSFIKELSPEGFSPDWKEKLLTDIDELPAVENSIVREKLREKAKQEEQEEISTEQEINIPEEKTQTDNTVKFPEKKQEVAPPEPVGRVNTSELPLAASIKEKAMRRMSRMKEFKSII